MLEQLHPRASQLIAQLALTPHPEGGFYREIFRSALSVERSPDRARRAALTSIYYLLPRGQHSSWHRVAADETWHWCEGAAMELVIAPPSLASIKRQDVGPFSSPALPASEAEPTRIVPAMHWQAARSTGDYTVVSCDVGPGFDFADFELLRDDSETLTTLQRRHPAWIALC